jgi:hypothetical protein
MKSRRSLTTIAPKSREIKIPTKKKIRTKIDRFKESKKTSEKKQKSFQQPHLVTSGRLKLKPNTISSRRKI